jgi:hypothetical protein
LSLLMTTIYGSTGQDPRGLFVRLWRFWGHCVALDACLDRFVSDEGHETVKLGLADDQRLGVRPPDNHPAFLVALSGDWLTQRIRNDGAVGHYLSAMDNSSSGASFDNA